MKKINSYFFIILIYLIALTSVYAVDEEINENDIIGKKEFVAYCASCHGSGGKGDGPVVNFLKRKPIDLTQLTKNNDNSFPFDRIWGVFDGSYQFDEHGSSEMPIWGYRFVREEDESSNAAKAKALNIILYIQVIQE